MPAFSLAPRIDEKPWGRHQLWPGFADAPPDAPPIGEVIFGGDATEALLVKYLFTSERLSIQVHPNDDQARADGYASGKDEAWVILGADPGAVIGLGLKQVISAEALRAAALDGSIEGLMDWRPVAAGDVIYAPAGTVHAIGGGITLIEIQQNLDLTYRLYDYGRPRPLHLAQGAAVATLGPYADPTWRRAIEPGRTILSGGGKFTLERWQWTGMRQLSLPVGAQAWLVPLSGETSCDGAAARAGSCWLFEGDVTLDAMPGCESLFASTLADAVALTG
jgi:mannose-6-phosphate isomerase